MHTFSPSTASQSTRQPQHPPEARMDTAHPSHSQTSSSSSDFWTAVAAGQRDVIECLRAQVRKQEGKEDIPDEHLVLDITANWDNINQAFRTGRLSKANFEQIRVFVNDTIGSPNWVDDGLRRVEHLLNACKAHDRIDKLLFYLRLTKPERYPEADMLFSIIHYLPKRPVPNLPSDKGVTSQHRDDTDQEGSNPPRNWLVHAKHAVLLTAKGAPLSRDEALRTLQRDVKEMCFAARQGWLDEQHKQRLHQIVAGCRELQADLNAWQERRNFLVDEATREAGKIVTDTLENEPPSFMPISEAYHFVSVLHQTYAQQPGRVFDNTRRMLQDLRRELHRDLIDTLIRTDLSKLSSDNT